MKTLALAVLLLSGCTVSAYAPSLEHAFDSCKVNGGLDFVVIGDFTIEAVCKNSAVFRIKNNVPAKSN